MWFCYACVLDAGSRLLSGSEVSGTQRPDLHPEAASEANVNPGSRSARPGNGRTGRTGASAAGAEGSRGNEAAAQPV